MTNGLGLTMYLIGGFVGGFIGFRLKITGGTIIGAMCAVIIINLILDRNFKIPASYTFITQVLIGLAGDTNAQLPIVLSFHIFRIFFIILTAPIAYKLLNAWLDSP